MQCACAVANTTSRVETDVDRTYDQVVHAPDKITLSDGHWDDTALVARIEQTVLCSTIQRKDTTTRYFNDTVTEHVAPTIVLGSIALVSGGVLAAMSGDFSDEPRVSDTGDDQLSQQKTGYAWAAILGVGGIIAVGQGLYIWGKSGTVVRDEKSDVGLVVAQSPGTPCETIPYNGTVLVELGRSNVDVQVVDGDLRLSLVPELCERPEGARVMLDGTHLGTLDIQDCYYAVKADEALAVVSDLRDPISARDILEAVDSLKIAQMAASKIQSEGWKTPIESKRGAMAARLKDVSRRVIDNLYVQVVLELRDGSEEVLSSVTNLLVISQTIGDSPKDDFMRLMSAIAEAPRSTPALVDLVVNAFPIPIQRCIRVAECDGLPFDQNDFQLAVETGFNRSSAQLVKMTTTLSSATRALSAKANESTLKEIEKAETQLTDFRDLCCHVGVPTVGFIDACSSAQEALDKAANAKFDAEQVLLKIRAARTAKEWRAVFPQCRKVAKGADALSGLSHCEGECRQALDRIQEDYRALQSFAPENAQYTPETIKEIRSECEKARCPRCP